MVKLICTLADHKDDVNCCALSSSYLATCSLDKTIRLYSLSNFVELPYSPLKGHTYAVHCCCFSPLGNILASCSTDGNTVLWNTENGLKLAVLEHPCRNPVRICRFSPNSTYLVSGAADGSVNLWNVQSLKVYRSGSVKDGSLVACAFAPDGNFFVTGSSCGDLTIWDDKMRCLYNEKAHDLGVTCCDFSAQPLSGIYVCKSNMINLCLELKYKCTLSGHSAPVLACAFSYDGQILVSGSIKSMISIYQVTSISRYVTCCAFAPDVPLFATGSMDKCVNIWQFEPKQCESALFHQKFIGELVLSDLAGNSFSRPQANHSYDTNYQEMWTAEDPPECSILKENFNNPHHSNILFRPVPRSRNTVQALEFTTTCSLSQEQGKKVLGGRRNMTIVLSYRACIWLALR
uniref:WD repeat, SAM and U-box domain-containing protein 1 n=1 Tax=Varanus komodoensis TaxID=61221 RepID=A0A8D2IQY6_VARKO